MATAYDKIPAWSSAGLLPPILPGEEPSSANRAPYLASMAEVVERFSTSSERIAILDGLFRFRRALYNAGLETGFQWLDGSFFENVEVLENRPPRDIDVVTFFHLKGLNQHYLVERHADLFDLEKVRQTYQVDSYWLPIDQSGDANLIRSVTYWHSMWSHNRNHTWKGFVQVTLDHQQDSNAQALLSQKGGSLHE